MQKIQIFLALMAVLMLSPIGYSNVSAWEMPMEEEEEEDNGFVSTPREVSNPPSLSGFNTRDADRLTFQNVIEQPIVVMSTTEIRVLDGKATERFVPVFFDGTLIDIIDVGRAPSGDYHETWLGFGGKIVDIPFEMYYMVTETGQLRSVGEYNQLRHIDLDGNVTYEEMPSNSPEVEEEVEEEEE